MNITSHTIISSIIALLLYETFGFKVILIIIGGVLIDIDHYMLYAKRKKKYNPIRAYRYFKEMGVELKRTKNKKEKKRFFDGLLIFHSIEFAILLVILSFFSEVILLLTIGIITHLLLDHLYAGTVLHTTKRDSLFYKPKNKTGIFK